MWIFAFSLYGAHRPYPGPYAGDLVIWSLYDETFFGHSQHPASMEDLRL